MLFEQRFWAGIGDGSITVAYRRWRQPRAVAGHRHRTPAGLIEIESVDVVDPATIAGADARRAGYPSPAELRADLRGSPELPVYRVRFHRVPGPDPREELAATPPATDADVADLDRRLDRLDRAGNGEPWTAAVLAAIADRPGVRAAELAAAFDRDVPSFKADVRKLKNLGLTLSLPVGYRLSPRGDAYLRHTGRRGPAPA